MDIKDNLVRLYIRRFVIPKALILDKPGFVDFKISGKTNVFARQVLVPEGFFIQLEKDIIEEYGDAGRSAIYSIGKKFGYSFSQLGRFENIKDHPGNGIKDWIIIASKFVEGTYASEIRQEIDLSSKTVNYTLKNFVICRKLGYDFFLATGGAAGVIAWLLQDKTIEGYYSNSKVVDNKYICNVTCSTFDNLKSSKDKVFRETNLDGLQQEVKQYNLFNQEVKVRYDKSFSSYLDAKIFNYEGGIIKLRSGNERFFLMEASGLYLLELGLKENGMDGKIFSIAYSIGQNLFEGLGNDAKSTVELMTALGWGEVILIPAPMNKIQIVINHFPWTKWYKDIDFLIIRGLLGGIFSKIYKREVKLNKPQADMHNNHLALIFEE